MWLTAWKVGIGCDGRNEIWVSKNADKSLTSLGTLSF
jgi:hypothetical protein